MAKPTREDRDRLAAQYVKDTNGKSTFEQAQKKVEKHFKRLDRKGVNKQ